MEQEKGMVKDKELANYFIDGLVYTVEKMTGFNLGNMNSEEIVKNPQEIICGMVLTGHESALLVLSTGKSSATVLASYLTGTEMNELTDEEVNNGIAELVNMVAGIVRANLAETKKAFTLAPSTFTIVGQKMNLLTSDYIEKYEHFFRANDIQLKLGIYYF